MVRLNLKYQQNSFPNDCQEILARKIGLWSVVILTIFQLTEIKTKLAWQSKYQGNKDIAVTSTMNGTHAQQTKPYSKIPTLWVIFTNRKWSNPSMHDQNHTHWLPKSTASFIFNGSYTQSTSPDTKARLINPHEINPQTRHIKRPLRCWSKPHKKLQINQIYIHIFS